MRYITLLFIITLFFPCSAYTQEPPNVIIMTLLGVNEAESTQDEQHQYIPHLWNDIKPQGTFYRNVTDKNFQFHLPSIAAINTGFHHFSINKAVTMPTIFQYARKKYRWPKTKAWMIGGWYNLGNCYDDLEYGEDTYPCWMPAIIEDVVIPVELEEKFDTEEKKFFDSYREFITTIPEHLKWPIIWDTADSIQLRLFKKILAEFKPKLVHYAIGNVETAHYDTYGRYVIALKEADRMIYEIWQLIKADPFYRDNTYFIVTTDHLRNTYYMQHSENPPSDPSKVWIYVWGPGIEKGRVIDRPVYHIDIFPTIARLMDIPVPKNQGTILEELLPHVKISQQ